MDTALIIILPIVSAGLTIASFFIARSVEAHKKGHKDGALEADSKYIKEKITTIAEEVEKINKSINDHLERIIRTEESAKAAHKRLDEIINK